jgi:Na+-translocating ferredoxin:NAD+ oxidoreductase subunit G
MSKTPSTFRNMVLSLTIISMGAAACLSFVYVITKEPIAASSLKKKLDAIRMVVPDFDNNPYEDAFKVAVDNTDSLEVYPAKKDGTIIAYAVNTYTKLGFSGNINLMAGFRTDGSIINIVVLEQKETPGLGAKMNESAFRDQFRDKNPTEFRIKVKKDGGNVDAITAATISSRAFCDAVQKAYVAIQKGDRK